MTVSISSQRPAICGIGAVSGYGWSMDALWDGVMSGVSAVVPHEQEGNTLVISRPPADGGDPEYRGDIYGRALLSAVMEAIGDARARGWTPGDQVGLIVSSSIGDVMGRRAYYARPDRNLKGRDYLHLMPSTALSHVMKTAGLSGGPSMNVQAACASSNVGAILGRMWLMTSMATDVIVAATDFSLMPEEAHHFVKLGAGISQGDPFDVCRPFQDGSRGFLGGEGAAAMVLSTQIDNPYGAILGGAMNHDPYHPISINPDRTFMMQAVESAMISAGVDSAQVAYLYAHGTGTRQGDTAEIEIIEKLLDPGVTAIATKTLTGHCQGASGGIEMAITARGFQERWMPSTKHVAVAHPSLQDGPKPMRDGACMKLSLGMGGFNAAVILAPVD